MVLGPDLRRGVADLDGKGEVVSGIVVMRHGQNALDVIKRVKAKIREIEPGLPKGVKIVPVYDRSDLILRAIDNLKSTLVEVIVTVALVILIFLWHIPSAIIPVITIPVAVLISFIPFRMLGVTANIMSLGGIAIAIGAMVDAAIVVVEQTHKKLEQWELSGRKEDYRLVVIQAIKQVAGPSFFALLVIAVSFLPVLTLEAQEGRLFKPLAYTKNLSMIVAAILAITLDPALRLFFTHMKHFKFRPRWLCRMVNAVLWARSTPRSKHPISRFLIRLYEPVVTWTLRRKWWVIAGALGPGADRRSRSIPGWARSSCRPWRKAPFSTCPPPCRAFPSPKPRKLLQVTDRIIKQFPGGGPGAGQGRPGRDLHRPGTAFHAGNGDHSQTQVPVAQKDTWYSTGRRSGLKPFCGASRRTISPRRN